MSDLPRHIRRARLLTDSEMRVLRHDQLMAVIRTLQADVREVIGQKHLEVVQAFFAQCRELLRGSAETSRHDIWANDGLTPMANRLFAHLENASSRCLKREQIAAGIYDDPTRWENMTLKNIDVMICKTRPALAALGYEISVQKSNGWFIDRATSDKFKSDLTAFQRHGDLPKVNWPDPSRFGAQK